MPDYRAIASQMAARYGLPAGLFASLIAHESNWNPGAISPAGAIGLGQLMPGTAQGLGVNPRDPVQNLQGAAHYLSDQYKRFHDWRLALAAYNAGPGAVAKYGGVPPYSETQAYVRNVLGSAGDLTPVASGRGPGIPPPSVAAPAPAAPTRPDVDPKRLRALLAQDLYRASQTGDYAGFLERSAGTRRQLQQAIRPKVPRGTKTAPSVELDHPDVPAPETEAVLKLAQHYLGTPYKWGGSSPKTGFDCSGFVQYVYGLKGVKIPRTTYQQIKVGQPVGRGQLRPGDIIFFGSAKDPHHEGLYIGNGQFIHAPRTGDVIKISSLADPYYQQHYVTARRVA